MNGKALVAKYGGGFAALVMATIVGAIAIATWSPVASVQAHGPVRDGVESAICDTGVVEVVRHSVIREARHEAARPVGLAPRGAQYACDEVNMGDLGSRAPSWVTIGTYGANGEFVVVGYLPTKTNAGVLVVDV